MIAQLKKIQVTPAKYNDTGGIDKREFATITLEVPIHDKELSLEFMEVLELTADEWVQVNIASNQLSIPRAEMRTPDIQMDEGKVEKI